MRIKNWRKFQHYGSYRTGMPWIKLYKKLLDDPEWFSLSSDASKLLVNLWLLASEHNGELPPMKDIAFRLRMKLAEVESLISELDHWLDKDASMMLADCLHDASTDEDRDRDTDKKDYRFSGQTIRVTDTMYDSWHTNFPDLDLNAHLQQLDDWISHQGDAARKEWIFRVSGALRKRQEEARAKKKPAVTNGHYKTFEPEPEKVRPSKEEREAQVMKLWRGRGRAVNAMVRGDDEEQEGTTGPTESEGTGL